MIIRRKGNVTSSGSPWTSVPGRLRLNATSESRRLQPSIFSVFGTGMACFYDFHSVHCFIHGLIRIRTRGFRCAVEAYGGSRPSQEIDAKFHRISLSSHLSRKIAVTKSLEYRCIYNGRTKRRQPAAVAVQNHLVPGGGVLGYARNAEKTSLIHLSPQLSWSLNPKTQRYLDVVELNQWKNFFLLKRSLTILALDRPRESFSSSACKRTWRLIGIAPITPPCITGPIKPGYPGSCRMVIGGAFRKRARLT